MKIIIKHNLTITFDQYIALDLLSTMIQIICTFNYLFPLFGGKKKKIRPFVETKKKNKRSTFKTKNKDHPIRVLSKHFIRATIVK